MTYKEFYTYVPMTGDLIHSGHIKFLEKIAKRGLPICIGLLTDKALKGYKKPVMSYKDREYVLKSLRMVSKVVPQNSLDPYKNLVKLRAVAIASGDGWEETELNAIKKWEEWWSKRVEKYQAKELRPGGKPIILNIKSGSTLHSSDIKQRVVHLSKEIQK